MIDSVLGFADATAARVTAFWLARGLRGKLVDAQAGCVWRLTRCSDFARLCFAQAGRYIKRPRKPGHREWVDSIHGGD